jgi:hypothetical protein
MGFWSKLFGKKEMPAEEAKPEEQPMAAPMGEAPAEEPMAAPMGEAPAEEEKPEEPPAMG